ncbi:MAG: arginine--tRNA ligase [Thermodesulfobacteriota bacterium]
MKNTLEKIVRRAAQAAYAAGDLNSGDFGDIVIEEPKVASHGDFATNFALTGAAIQKMSPKKIAEAIIRHMDDPEQLIRDTQIAGPGFINFFISSAAWLPVLRAVHEQEALFGAVNIGRGRRVQVEFVSANPTGPLHVGHGRGAVVGDALAAILNFCGFTADREYYINDAGRQIRTLGRSVYLRCMELAGRAADFPEDAYQGEYIYDIARSLMDEKKTALFEMDADSAVDTCARYAADKILENIRRDLKNLGIGFDTWFSEQSLYDSGKVAEAIQVLLEKNLAYEAEGATWFKSSMFGDEKDRVIVRGNGLTTYFASDIAYHMDKYDRGYERVIDVWGADHHGYVPRLSAAITALGRKPDQFRVVLAHLVNLVRQGVPVSMSTRAGQFVTLREVVDEVGVDAARFLFLTRHHESPLDFDLELAKQKTNENPVYYVQYVYARISSIMKKAAAEHGISSHDMAEPMLAMLTEPEEIQLMKQMAKYPEAIAGAANMMEPHRVAYYLMELAAAFHAYYNKHRVLTQDTELSRSRLYLVKGVRTVIGNGLTLLGVSTPETM